MHHRLASDDPLLAGPEEEGMRLLAAVNSSLPIST